MDVADGGTGEFGGGRERGEGRDAPDFGIDHDVDLGGGLGGARGLGRADVSALTRGDEGESFSDQGRYDASTGMFGPSYDSVLSRNLENRGRQFGETYGGWLGGFLGGLSPIPGGGLLGSLAGKLAGPAIGAAYGRSQYDTMAPGSLGARGGTPEAETAEAAPDAGPVDAGAYDSPERRAARSLYPYPAVSEQGRYPDSYARTVFGAGPQSRRM